MAEGSSSVKHVYSRKSAVQGQYSIKRPLSTDKVNFHPKGIYSHANFIKHALNKDVAIERVFDDKYLHKINFKYNDLLKKYGWWDFITNPTYKVRINLVRLFYFNADKKFRENGEDVIRNDKFRTNVCGVDIVVTREVIREILLETYSDKRGFICEENEQRTIEDSRVVYENPRIMAYTKEAPTMGMDNRILHFIVCQVLQVRKGSYSVATMHDLWWMARIIRDDPPDLCASIFVKIRDALENAHKPHATTQGNKKDLSLPFGKLITRLIEKRLENRLHVDEPFALPNEEMNAFTSVSAMGWKIDERTGERRRKNEPEQEAPNVPITPYMEEIRGMFAQTQAGLAELQRHQLLQEAQNLHNHENIEALRRNEPYTSLFPTYDSFFDPPPPPSS